MQPGSTFLPFFFVCAAFGAVFAIALYSPVDVRLKRQIWRYGVVVGTALALAYFWWTLAFPWWFLVPLGALNIWLNWKVGRFCDACGAFQQRFVQLPWHSIRPSPNCIRCGEKIRDPKSADL